MSLLDTIADLDEVTQAAFVGILACSAVFATFALMAQATRGARWTPAHRCCWTAELLVSAMASVAPITAAMTREAERGVFRDRVRAEGA